MQIGASTANYYPALIEDALETLLRQGFRDLEVFINTESEITDSFIDRMALSVQQAGARVVSLHSYTSGNEPYLLFSAYERRFQDGCRVFEKIFRAASRLGATYVVLHGDRAGGVLSMKESVARFEYLYDMGREQGVTLAQENVVRFRASELEYLRYMRQTLGDKAHFVLDIKQCRRCGLTWREVLQVMGDRVAHVHVSDWDDTRDCLPPGTGKEDFAALFRMLQKIGFDGTAMLELYRSDFKSEKDLNDSAEFLKKTLKNL